MTARRVHTSTRTSMAVGSPGGSTSSWMLVWAVMPLSLATSRATASSISWVSRGALAQTTPSTGACSWYSLRTCRTDCRSRPSPPQDAEPPVHDAESCLAGIVWLLAQCRGCTFHLNRAIVSPCPGHAVSTGSRSPFRIIEMAVKGWAAAELSGWTNLRGTIRRPAHWEGAGVVSGGSAVRCGRENGFCRYARFHCVPESH